MDQEEKIEITADALIRISESILNENYPEPVKNYLLKFFQELKKELGFKS